MTVAESASVAASDDGRRPASLRVERVIAYLACVVSAGLVYRRLPVHFFWGDDWGFLAGVRLLGLDHLTEPVHWYFQPLSWRLHFVALHALAGLDAARFDLVQVALLFVAAALAFEVVVESSGRPALGLLALGYLVRTASFALIAGWTSCIAYVLATLFELATLLVVLRACTDARPPSLALSLGVCVSFALSWLSKNSTLLFPVPLAVLLAARITPRGRTVLEALLAACGLSVLHYALALAPHQPTVVSGVFSLGALAKVWSMQIFQAPSLVDDRLFGSLWPSLFRMPVPCLVVRAALGVLAVRAAFVFLRRRDLESASAVAFTLLASCDVVLTLPVNPDRAIYQAQMSFAIGAALLASVAVPRRWRGLPPGIASQWLERGMRALPSTLAALVLVGAAAGFEDPYLDNKREMLCQWRQLTQVMVVDPAAHPVVEPAPPERADWFPFMAETFWGPLPASPPPRGGPASKTFEVRVGGSRVHIPYHRDGVSCELPLPVEAVASGGSASEAAVAPP